MSRGADGWRRPVARCQRVVHASAVGAVVPGDEAGLAGQAVQVVQDGVADPGQSPERRRLVDLQVGLVQDVRVDLDVVRDDAEAALLEMPADGTGARKDVAEDLLGPVGDAAEHPVDEPEQRHLGADVVQTAPSANPAPVY